MKHKKRDQLINIVVMSFFAAALIGGVGMIVTEQIPPQGMGVGYYTDNTGNAAMGVDQNVYIVDKNNADDLIYDGELGGEDAEGCPDATYYVDSHTDVRRGDGSIEEPFIFISDALEEAANEDCERVTLFVNIGVHAEDFASTITRHTTIAGYDFANRSRRVLAQDVEVIGLRLTQDGPYELNLSHIMFSGDPPDEENSEASNFRIIHQDAHTNITHVHFQDMTDHALWQSGGTLYMDHVNLSLTHITPTMYIFVGGQRLTIPPGVDSGAAIVLDGEVTAEILNTNCISNEGGCLRASGRRTKVYASNLYAHENGVILNRIRSDLAASQIIQHGSSAIEARDRAILLIDKSQISENFYVGVASMDGGRTHLRDTAIRSTKGIRLEGRNGTYGGMNVLALTTTSPMVQGVAEMAITDVTSTHAVFAGLKIQDAIMRLTDSNITNNAIGIMVSNPLNLQTPDVNCAFGSVLVFDNARDFSNGGGNAELPNPDDLLDGGDREEDHPFCAHVPFNCTWCRD